MIHKNEITPKYGESYLLYIDGDSDNSFYGYYIGKSLVTNERWQENKYPDGHKFVRVIKDKLELYYVNTNDFYLILHWMCERYDETTYPVGFTVEKFEYKFTKYEEEYLRELISEKIIQQEKNNKLDEIFFNI